MLRCLIRESIHTLPSIYTIDIVALFKCAIKIHEERKLRKTLLLSYITSSDMVFPLKLRVLNEYVTSFKSLLDKK